MLILYGIRLLAFNTFKPTYQIKLKKNHVRTLRKSLSGFGSLLTISSSIGGGSCWFGFESVILIDLLARNSLLKLLESQRVTFLNNITSEPNPMHMQPADDTEDIFAVV